MSWTIAAFYKFTSIAHPGDLRLDVLAAAAAHGIIGTILIAPEGINATIAGQEDSVEPFLVWLRALPPFADLEVKFSSADKKPFGRLKVRLKREIVTLGEPSANPSERVGTYVEPAGWNALISSPDVVTIDTRNSYEVKIGTFEGAVDPEISSFGEFPAYVRAHLDPARHTRVAMFCTGGIRCEKATAYLLSQGFKDVYHLKGGILKYLENVPPGDSLWRGDCFVFDERVAVGDGVKPSAFVMCRKCGTPVPEVEACHMGKPEESRAQRVFCRECAQNEVL